MQALYIQRPVAAGGSDPALAATVANHGLRLTALYSGGHVSFKKVNGVWLQMTYGT